MKKPYFTRKNLIAISLIVFYVILVVFTGACIEGTHAFVTSRNIINAMAKALKFTSIEAGLGGYISLIVIAIYVLVFALSVIYIGRFFIKNNKKAMSAKAWIFYAISFLVCILMATGIIVLVHSPKTWDNISKSILFTAQSFGLGTIIYVGLALLIGSITMLVVNFINVDKPFKFFGKNLEQEMIEDEEESNLDDDVNVAASFDADVKAQAIAGAASATGEGISSIKKVEELDDREKVFPTLSKLDVTYSGFSNDLVPTDDVTLSEICDKFRNYLAKEEKLYFDIDTIRMFVSAFSASHFMILEGLSGTGKSSLPRYFAKFCNGDVLFMPVQATWRDKSNLFGYFNEFSKTYNETEFLVKLYNANYNPDKINVFVLDEMNISRVEYYFADLLSVLEYPEEDWKVRLMQLPYNFLPPVKLTDGYVTITPNCYFVGTANKDDSTFSIADKVYDRAITIDFDYRNDPFSATEDASTINLSNSKLRSLYTDAENIKLNQMSTEDHDKLRKVTDFIYEEFDVTFGNRILTQIDTIVPTFVACGGTKDDAIDFLLSRKVLSKLEGRFEEYVKVALKELLQLITSVYGQGKLPRSEKAINQLIRKL